MVVSPSSLKKKKSIYLRAKHKTNTRARLNTSAPRAIVSRSLKHLSVQVVTLDGASLVQIKDFGYSGTKVEKAQQLGSQVAKALLDKGISKVIFDRNGYRYHGRVAHVAQSMRDSGISL